MGGFEGVDEGGEEQSSEYKYAHGVWYVKGMQLEAGGGSRVRLRLPGSSGIRCSERELSNAEYELCGCRCRYCHVWVALPKKDVCASR